MIDEEFRSALHDRLGPALDGLVAPDLLDGVRVRHARHQRSVRAGLVMASATSVTAAVATAAVWPHSRSVAPSAPLSPPVSASAAPVSPSVAAAPPPAASGLAFTSAEQITSADARVLAAMLATAGTGATVTLSTPTVITATTRRTIHEVDYQKDGTTVTLLENVSAPSGAAELGNLGITGKDRNSPCTAPHHPPVTEKDGSVVTTATSILCMGKSLPDGAMLWTFVTHWGGHMPDSAPNAVVEEPDGSTVFVQTSALKAGHDSAETLTRGQVGALAVTLEKAWRS